MAEGGIGMTGTEGEMEAQFAFRRKMCGIIAYLGYRSAVEVCLNGLKRLEYRGYDSAGISVVHVPEGTDEPVLEVVKKQGKVAVLETALQGNAGMYKANCGIGHTRWATHGEPSDVNAHPHQSNSLEFALVHNGIIENCDSLREGLRKKGYVFHSKTDTETLAVLIEDVLKTTDLDLEEAIREALCLVKGTYGLALVDSKDPTTLYAARKGSPLLVGIGNENESNSGKEEYFIASDAAPFIEFTKRVVHVRDNELVVVKMGSGYHVRTLENVKINAKVELLEWDLEQIEKGGHPHFMLKEILEQPISIANCLRGRLHPDAVDGEDRVRLGGLMHCKIDNMIEKLANATRIIIVACGTSWHAALVGEYMLEYMAEIPVEVEYASEFRYRHLVLKETDVVLAISQSGETADTLEAIRIAKRRGLTVCGICNVVGSTIPRETDGGVYLHVGPEIGVGSTKAFTGQVTVLAMISLVLGYHRKVHSMETLNDIMNHLAKIPSQMTELLEKTGPLMQEVSKVYRFAQNFLFLGRGYEYPVALEGALKLKEISYIHAEGYPAAEMKHGPIALIDPLMPVVVVATKDRLYDKVKANIEEIVTRRGSVIAITDEDAPDIEALCQYVIKVPKSHECLQPLLTVIPLQLLSYHVAVYRGCNVDQPRNLAKSVTVE